jgi:hypothetical protein
MKNRICVLEKQLKRRPISMSEVAEYIYEKYSIDTGRNRIFKLLRDTKYLNSNNEPTWNGRNAGYFTTIIAKRPETGFEFTKLLVYEKGVALIHKLLMKR